MNDIPGVWISFKIDDDDYWVALDRDQLDNVTGLQWAGWGVFALALSLFGAAFITSLVNRPFARLADGRAQGRLRGSRRSRCPSAAWAWPRRPTAASTRWCRTSNSSRPTAR